MSAVKGKNTVPENKLKKILSKMGIKYNVHVKSLPGSPDFHIRNTKKVIFLHGCFWHRHYCKKGMSLPKSNRNFWINKFKKNVLRDKNNYRKLNHLGYKYRVIWECQLKNSRYVQRHLEF